MSICYNIVYNTSTSAFEKHGGVLVDDTGVVLHDCGYYVNTDSTINPLLNLSATSQYGTTSANTDLASSIIEADQSTSGTPNHSNSNVNRSNPMRIQLTIIAISPVIKTKYIELPNTKPHEVVTR